MGNQPKTTQYPSADQVWRKKYAKGDCIQKIEIPANKTVWDVIEEKLLEYPDVPALEYFKKKTSRKEFIESVYMWAKALKAIGVGEDEVIPVYGLFYPEICAITFAINMIGATAYFLKLAITPEALAEETRDSKIAVVCEELWENVKGEFQKDKYQKVIIIAATDAMPVALKYFLRLSNSISKKGNKLNVPTGEKYLRIPAMKKISKQYKGTLRADFVADRNAFITSSSGTTVNGVVKGTVATNESTLAQLVMASHSEIQYFAGDRCLNNLPPTASTSLNALFFLPLYQGLTVVVDPRVSEKDFYDQIIKNRPNIVLTTGSMWEAFFNRVGAEMKQGKKFDFTCAKGWTIGGEGSIPKKFSYWNSVMREANAASELFSGYGSSEVFSGVSVDKHDARSNTDNMRPVMGVGLPYLEIIIGVFDSSGKELPYNTRGELWVKTLSAMKEYYHKPQLTSETLVDGWIHTGDLAEIDEQGYLYIWGRLSDKIDLPNGSTVYVFDIANKIKENPLIDDAIVFSMPTEKEITLAAHIVWDGNIGDEKRIAELEIIDKSIAESFPAEITIAGYYTHEGMLPYSSTTLKKDRNGMSKILSGYEKVTNGKAYNITFKAVNDGNHQLLEKRIDGRKRNY